MTTMPDGVGGRYAGRRLLVTGGAGYIGTSVLRRLSGSGARVIRLDRPGMEFPPAVAGIDVKDVAADVAERSTWDLVDEVDVVIHLAGQTSTYAANADPAADLEMNVRPMLHLLERCRRRQGQVDVLFAGTATQVGVTTKWPVDETHADCPATIYDLHKCMAEGYLKHYAREGIVRGAVLRLSNVYGPGPRSSSRDRGVLNAMIRKALKQESLTIYGRGEHIRDYVYVEDVANAFFMAGARMDAVNGQHFLVGSGQGTTIGDGLRLVAERVAAKTGARAPVVHVDPPADLSPIESRHFVADTGRFRRATGWQPCVSLAEGIDRTIAAMLGEGQSR